MARTLTPVDAHQLMNLLLRQATGEQSITVTDTSSFVSAGELVLATGMENVTNSVSIVMNRLIVASRAYNARMRIVQTDEVGSYSNRARKISFYSQNALPDGSHNTNLFTNLAAGYTSGDNGGASTKSQWEQHPAMPLEMNFAGTNVWQHCITMYEDQLKIAFRNEEEFNRFVSGYLQEHANDIEQEREGFYRALLLNRIGMTFDMSADMPGALVDLTTAFNTFYNISPAYTTQQLLSTYFKEFCAFFVSQIKLYSDYMENRSINYHWSVPKTVGGDTFNILRHTPKRDQRLAIYAPYFTMAESLVYPEIFNPQYLSIENAEKVNFWQAEDTKAAINITPAIIETDSTDPAYGTQIQGSAVAEDHIIAVLFDRDAVFGELQLNRADSTPLEARKHYRNVWNTFAKNGVNDPTENFIVFYMS